MRRSSTGRAWPGIGLTDGTERASGNTHQAPQTAVNLDDRLLPAFVLHKRARPANQAGLTPAASMTQGEINMGSRAHGQTPFCAEEYRKSYVEKANRTARK